MKKGFLNAEKQRILGLETELNKILNIKKDTLQNREIQKNVYNKFNYIMSKTRDYNIEDTLNFFLKSFTDEMRGILDNKLAPGMQFGIRNKYFNLIAYGGKDNNKDIEENTFFSFDSISKLLTSTTIIQDIKNNNYTIDSQVNSINNSFNLDANIRSILNFTAQIKTNGRIDGLNKEETLKKLKEVKENINEKYNNYYQYNDIGYMILRLSIDNFLEKLDNVLKIIDTNNLTYNNYNNKNIITGGKKGTEYITPDTKGRDIPYPGHTGLYGNITGLINMFDKIIFSNEILTDEDRKILFTQPYTNPVVYNSDGSQKIGKNGSKQYTCKIAGIYRKPNNIKENNFNKLASCDMSDKTTDKAIASTGTCGSWVVCDKLNHNKRFSQYIGGILTNPYSFIEDKTYPNKRNAIENTNLEVNEKGVILGYQTKLNKYKELVTEYSLILELITEYIKMNDINALEKANKKLVKKIK